MPHNTISASGVSVRVYSVLSTVSFLGVWVTVPNMPRPIRPTDPLQNCEKLAPRGSTGYTGYLTFRCLPDPCFSHTRAEHLCHIEILLAPVFFFLTGTRLFYPSRPLYSILPDCRVKWDSEPGKTVCKFRHIATYTIISN